MDSLLTYCAKFSPLTGEAADELLACTTTKTCKKGGSLLRKSQVCSYIFFINEGLLKLSLTRGNKQFVMRFFAENTLFSVFDSYLTQTPSRFTLTALENTNVTRIGYGDLESLCKRHHCVETLFRNVLSVATTKMTKRISEMLEDSSTERYQQFVHENEAVMQRISLGDIANYLGITQQSLSRIRASAHYLTYGKKNNL